MAEYIYCFFFYLIQGSRATQGNVYWVRLLKNMCSFWLKVIGQETDHVEESKSSLETSAEEPRISCWWYVVREGCSKIWKSRFGRFTLRMYHLFQAMSILKQDPKSHMQSHIWRHKFHYVVGAVREAICKKCRERSQVVLSNIWKYMAMLIRSQNMFIKDGEHKCVACHKVRKASVGWKSHIRFHAQTENPAVWNI